MNRTAAIAGALIGLAALLLQMGLTIPARLGTGDNIVGALVYFFTFFTILTNLFLVLIYAAELSPTRALGWFRDPVTRGALAASITLVGLFYHFVLAATWSPEGMWKLADVVLHYVTPIFYLVWWALFVRHGTLKWTSIPLMLVPPLVYLAWALLRGAVMGEYPYPVLEANRLGYGAVAINILGLLIGLGLLCAIVVAADMLLARRHTAQP